MRAMFAAVILAIPGPVLADTRKELNPYRAVLSGMSVDEAEPLIEAQVGPIAERIRSNGRTILKSDPEGPLLRLSVAKTGIEPYPPSYFFCRDALIAFDAPISQAMAARLFRSGSYDEKLDAPHYFPHVSPTVLQIRTPDRELVLTYYFKPDTRQYTIRAIYPVSVHQRMDFDRLCPEE